MNRYLIFKRANVEVYDWIGGYVCDLHAWSKKRAVKQASKRWNIPGEQLMACMQYE